MSNIIQFLNDFGIEYSTHGNRHSRPGWIQIHCPFCVGSQDFHLGYNLRSNFWNCFRCGFKRRNVVISELTGAKNWPEILSILQKYFDHPNNEIHLQKEQKKIKYQNFLTLPSNTGNHLTKQHHNYIMSRNFIPREIIRDWGISSCISGSKYKGRLLIPIVFEGRIVSFQTRDTTSKSELRYLSCDRENEVVHHKNILYGIDEIKHREGILVEGVFDAWRIGIGTAVCSFGIKLTNEQIELIQERFDRLYILFDSEPEAQRQAKRISRLLRGLGVISYQIDLETGDDPGAMTNTQLVNFRKEMKKIFDVC